MAMDQGRQTFTFEADRYMIAASDCVNLFVEGLLVITDWRRKVTVRRGKIFSGRILTRSISVNRGAFDTVERRTLT